MHNYYQDKVVLTLSAIVSSFISTVVGLASAESDIRWACMTVAVSILVSCFLSLSFRRPTESIKVVIGRAGITLVAGVFGTRALVHYYALKVVNEDIFLLGAVSSAVCIVAYFPGHSLIKSLDKESNNFGSMLLRLLAVIFKVPLEKDKDKEQ